MNARLPQTYLAQVASYTTSFEYDNIPGTVTAKLRTSVLYALVMGLTGYHRSDHFWQGLADIHPDAEGASLLVSGKTRAPADAAFINAALVCVRGQNDTFPSAVAHAGCVAIPAVLAVAQQRGSSGRDVLTALSAGYEVMAKLAAPASSLAVARGFRSTSVFGVFASTAAVARLLDLNETQTAHALSLATQFASGTMQCWEEGTPEWRLQVGNASRAGVIAAMAASKGLTASAQALEGKRGFYACFCGAIPDIDLSGWVTDEVVYKPFPGCLINQGPIHVLRGILAEHSIKAAEIRSVSVGLHPQNADYPGIINYGPFGQQTGAVMSAPFMLEVILREGTLRQSHFETQYGEHAVHAGSRRIAVYADAGLPAWGCEVKVELQDGRRFNGHIDDQSCFAYGWDETVAVLDTLVVEWPFPDAAERYASMKSVVANLENSNNISELINLCTPAGRKNP